MEVHANYGQIVEKNERNLVISVLIQLFHYFVYEKLPHTNNRSIFEKRFLFGFLTFVLTFL